MRKLILGVLLMQSLTLPGQSTLHCIPRSESEILHEMAGKYLVAHDEIINLNERIDTLQDRVTTQQADFKKLLVLSEKKYLAQKQVSENMASLSNSFRDQLTYYQKKERKQRIQNRFLKGGIILAGGFIVYLSAKD